MNHEGHKLALEVRFISRAFNNSIEGLKGHAPVPAGRAIPVDVNHQVVQEVVLGLGEVLMRRRGSACRISPSAASLS